MSALDVRYSRERLGDDSLICCLHSSRQIVVATIFSHAIIAERTPVTLHAVGSMGWGMNRTVTSVSVVFDGAYTPINGTIPLVIGPIYAEVELTPTKNLTEKPEKLGVILGGTYLAGKDAVIEWLVQDYYYPSLTVHFDNGNSASVTYKQYPVHVESYSTLESERTNGNLKTLEVAALAIAMSEGLSYFDKQAEKRQLNKNSERKNNKASDKDESQPSQLPLKQNGKRNKISTEMEPLQAYLKPYVLLRVLAASRTFI
jgi:hypothetical protein